MLNFGGIEKVKFRTDRKAKKQKYPIDEVDNILFTVSPQDGMVNEWSGNSSFKTYVPVLLKKGKFKDLYLFMEEIVIGTVSLYGRTVTQTNGGWMPGGTTSAAPVYIGGWSEHNQLWVARDGEEVKLINHVSLFKGFKKRASEYFGDCSTVVAQLQDRELEKEHLKEIVEFYNDVCG